MTQAAGGDLNAKLERAMEHHRAGRLRDAEQLYRQIIAADPVHFPAIHMLGLLAHHAGNTKAGIELMNHAATINPNVPELHINLATLWMSQGHLPQALRHAREAVRLKGDFPLAWRNLAVVLNQAGELQAAADAWRQLAVLQPNEVEPHANLAATLQMLGRPDDALPHARRAMEIAPDHPQAMNNLGAILTELGHPEQALALHQRAVQLNPKMTSAWVNLASAQQWAGHLDEAADAARRAIQLDAENVQAWQNLAGALQERGDIDEARQACDRAVAILSPRRADQRAAILADRLRAMAAIMLPAVYDSVEHVDRARDALVQRIAELKNESVRLPLDDSVAPTLFTLAYQGLDDRQIMADYASLMMPPTDLPIEPRNRKTADKIRIGLISRFFKDHTIGRLNLGLIRELSREQFDVTAFTVSDPQGELGRQIASSADRHMTLPASLPAARAAIANQRLDVLFYTDLGMDPVTYSLAFSRLAPVQCTTWGHPVTSGVPAIDYFISSNELEIDGSDAQYTERLVRLDSLAVYYDRPSLASSRKARRDFGLPEDAHLYGCLQMLWKFHPDFDELLSEILRRDAKGELLLIRGLNRRWDDQLTARLRRVMPDVADRIRWLPRQSYDDFLTLASLCDVMLDPPHFGGGNTTYEALAFGVPVVTLPSQLLRGRITLALYRQMGLDECVATSRDDYVDRAVQLTTDRDFRHHIRGEIERNNNAIFNNAGGVRAFEEWTRSILQP